MRMLVALTAVALMLGCSSKPAALTQMAPDQVRYIIEPTNFENKPALKVSLTFVGRSEGKTYLELPDRWASEANYFKDIKELKVITEGVTMSDGGKPFIKELKHQPSRIIDMTYIVTQRKPQGPQPFRTLVTNDYFHFMGYSVFVAPTPPEKATFKFDVIWKNFPANFKMANSFASDVSRLNIRTRLSSLKHAVYVGGDFRLKEVSVNGKPLVMALKGKWLFSDDEFYNTTKKVVEYQRDFWKDDDFPFFFVVLLPEAFQESGSAGGTALTNSFAMSMTPEMTLKDNVIPLLSHELFHTWNGGKIMQVNPEALRYWFSEGFTVYYSRLLNLRSGLIDLPQYVSAVNNDIYEYYTSRFRDIPNTRIAKDFWVSDSIGKLPYYRGNFLAMNWDHRIKTDSQNKTSLDFFMKDVFEDAKKGPPIITEQYVEERIKKFYPLAGADLRTHIAQGNMITPEEKALGPCVKRSFISMGKFEHGYDREKTYSTGIVTGLKNGTPAHEAGLREGMKLLDRKMINPPFAPSKIKVLSKGSEKWVSFTPVGRKKYLMPHFVIDEKLWKKDPVKCLSWFAAIN